MFLLAALEGFLSTNLSNYHELFICCDLSLRNPWIVLCPRIIRIKQIICFSRSARSVVFFSLRRSRREPLSPRGFYRVSYRNDNLVPWSWLISQPFSCQRFLASCQYFFPNTSPIPTTNPRKVQMIRIIVLFGL